MKTFPQRIPNRIEKYDYSTPGSYFVTVCTAKREKIFWRGIGAATCRPNLSEIGAVAETAILQIPKHYPAVSVDKYCVMPDHIHMILSVNTDENGRQVAAPTVSTVVGNMKRWVSMRLGRSIWQKSFYDHAIRNQQDYKEIWRYIENNPQKYLLGNGN